MKNLAKIALLLICSLSLFSCEDFLPNSEGGDILDNSSDPVDIYSSLAQSLQQNMLIADLTIAQKIELIDRTAMEKQQLTPISDVAKKVPDNIKALNTLVNEICTSLEGAQGKSRVRTLMIAEGNATRLKDLINETRADLIKLPEALVRTMEAMPISNVRLDGQGLAVLKESLMLATAKGEKWEEDNFGSLSASACVARLRKYQSDSKNAVLQVLHYLSENMRTTVLTYDKFDVFASSEKPYILLGETFEAEIGLGVFSSQAEFTVSVNGSPLRVDDGKAKYAARPRMVGTQSYTAKINIVNPLTGETETVRKEFKYEVGAPSVMVAADHMNVFYMGVDNPIYVAAAGISSNDVDVRISGGGGGSLVKVANGRYNVKVTKQTVAREFCNIDVYDKKNNKRLGSYPFRVKRIPDPIAKLTNNEVGGLINSSEMKQQRGLMAILENFDFDAKCQIQSFTLYATPSRQDPVKITNSGGAFSGQALQTIQAAKPGTSYQFIDVKGRCPGDTAGRDLNSLAFLVK